MFKRKGYRQLKEYNWLKRLIALALSIGLLFIVNIFYPIPLAIWITLIVYAFCQILWYGSQVKIDSLVIGFRYSIFFFLLTLSLQVMHQSFHPMMLLVSLSFVTLSLITSWSLPRVKLGLKNIKPLLAIKSSLALILIGYNVIAYFLISKNIPVNFINSLALLSGCFLLYSTYSPFGFIHFLIFTYLVPHLIYEMMTIGQVSLYHLGLGTLLILIFYIIQFNAKPIIKKETIR